MAPEAAGAHLRDTAAPSVAVEVRSSALAVDGWSELILNRPDEVPSEERQWLSDARQELSSLREVTELAGFVTNKRAELAQRASPLAGKQRCALLSDLTDLVVRRMLDVACEDTDEHPDLQARAERSLAIAATGGYGRRELAPYSDVDISFIAASDEDPELDFITRRMFRLIMDVFLAEAKLKVGYAYRLLGEAATLHHQNQTALLDSRFVVGSREVFQSFHEDLRRNIHPVAFIHDKLRERESTIARHGGSIYRVEPDIKEGEGSLRDLQMTSWLAQVGYGFSNSTVWEDIRSHGLLSEAEARKVDAAQEFFARTRWEMHVHSGKQSDSLTVAKQEALAKVLGYDDGPEEAGVECLMRDYYEHAEVARHTAEKMISKVRLLTLKLEPGLVAKHGEVVLQNPEVFGNDPVAALRAFAYGQRYGLSISQGVLDALRTCAASCPGPVDNPDAARTFLMILRSENVADTLVSMARTGVLAWYMPEFGKVKGLVPMDAAHEYSVGWHSLLVAHHCERLGKSADEDARRIFASLRQPELLYLLALTHDMGKFGSSGDHAERGAGVARAIGERVGLDSEAAGMLEHLVRHHQLMSDTARLRDLTLRRTVDDFVAIINDTESLSMLYIFTNSDILSVGSAAWNELQGRFLRELYHRAERAIITRKPLIDSDEDMAQYRRRVRRELSLTNLPHEDVEEHVTLMPSIYLLNVGPEEMAEHIGFINKAKEGQPSVEFSAEIGSDYTDITLCVQDDPKPGLLSKIAGVLWALDVEVQAAQVFTRSNQLKIALDKLYVNFEGKQLPEFKRHQVQREMVGVLKGDTSVEDLLTQKKKSLGLGYASTGLEVLNHLSEQHTVVDIRASDQPGLLYRFTKAFASLGWDIHSARVSTWGNEARDSFYVTQQGEKLSRDAAEQLERVLQSL